MIECERCHRHIRQAEASCPFCDAPSRIRMAMSVVGGAVTTIVLAACYGPPDGGIDYTKYPTGGTGDTGMTTTEDTGATTTTTMSAFEIPRIENDPRDPGTCDPTDLTPQ
jgi:hypothetical protein